MYNRISLFVLTTLVLVVAGCSETQKVYDNTPLQGSSVVFGVAGMGCPKCANNITLVLDKVDGVDGPKIDMSTGLVTIDFVGDSRPSESDLATAVRESGFTYKGIKE
tara:strand:+ start:205 stop:525 length:321 start_codon:yes stop_codon:yes gene_type:complete